MQNNHPYTGYKKERVGWGKWGIVYTRRCIETNKEIRIRKNWHGPRPKGAIECPYCHKFMDL